MKKITISMLLLVAAAQPALADVSPVKDPAYINMVESIANNEYTTFMNGGDSVIGGSVVGPYSASELIAMYEKNELAANKKLKGKRVRIKSIASEIGENATGDAYVKADGKNQFENIFLYVDGDDEKILQLEKGSKIDFLCSMDKYIMHTPMLKKCTFTVDSAKKTKADIVKLLEEEKITNKFQAAMRVIYEDNKEVITKSCSKPGNSCNTAILHSASKATDKQKKRMEELMKNNQ